MDMQLSASVARLKRLCSEMESIRVLGTVDARREILRFRKEVTEALNQFAKQVEAAADRRKDAQLLSDCRERFGEVRTAMAKHQAKWPAVSIDEQTGAYLASADGLRRKISELLQWAEARARQ